MNTQKTYRFIYITNSSSPPALQEVVHNKHPVKTTFLFFY